MRMGTCKSVAQAGSVFASPQGQHTLHTGCQLHIIYGDAVIGPEIVAVLRVLQA